MPAPRILIEMKKYRVLFLVLLLPMIARCEEPIVELFPPTVTSKYKGGCGTFGKASVEPRQGEAPINLTVTAWKSGIMWWFANHTQIPRGAVESWGNYAIRVEFRMLDNAQNVTVKASWRGVAEPAIFSEQTMASVDVEANAWTAITLPAPDISAWDADRINGLGLEFPEGHYEIRKIDIVPAP
ncbi:hypothetical protein TSACC_3303 [Terrimicrobium sacchariphilum]|uniref:Uncharacterized protein n=2 Tax=Terrimicrobium sacchariphilum TaxID=690879 RepID=A0A146GCB3_TERSA|nr:hypothetical protein TSACC_3303 [Terrimicrobium sacchariphilum]